LRPCQCKGSIQHVHFGCLRHWIKSNNKKNLDLSDDAGSYLYRSPACELCKAVYPTDIWHRSECFPLVELPQTQPPFIVLENMMKPSQPHSQQHSRRSLHVVSLRDKPMKLGRSLGNEICIADVSISRCHATIRFHRNSFILEDNNSKFGTHVALRKSRLLEAGKPISIQMGRTVLQLTLQPNPDGGSASRRSRLPSLSSATSTEDEHDWRLQWWSLALPKLSCSPPLPKLT
jgi:hypothetical protein